MKKKDWFFANVFLVCFLMCGAFLAGGYLTQKVKTQPAGEGPEQETEQKPEADRGTQETGTPGGEETAEPSREGEQEQGSGENAGLDRENMDGAWENVGESMENVPGKDEQTREEFFSDALFIGDSRTVGLMEYGDVVGADFFADSGMSVFSLYQKKLAVGGEKQTIQEVLEGKQYGKIFLMLGINELGYSFENLCKKYQEVVQQIRESQSQSMIYLCANLHVTKEQSGKDPIYNNGNIDRVNEMIASLADQEKIIYVDVNALFDDGQGNLATEYSSDSFHVLGKYYKDWADWLWTTNTGTDPAK